MAVDAKRIELWGGVECTVNRVGDAYRDQLRLSGHQGRLDDLDRFAGLGIKGLRYPVLWERTAPAGIPDWTWPDPRLERIRLLGMRPIVGLVHHGSGPRHTHLLDDGFAPGLGAYAGQVAARYPWVEAWTPVNEPLTTARFAALYGHWYPHAADERSFWLALLNQIDATRAAMTAIRSITPTAKLVQTDDLGRTYATPALGAQADHDNLRRWAGWDLLFGRIDPRHPLFERLDVLGFGDRLRAIADDPCPPDIVGVNHYLTSDRFLDHRLDRYPGELHGGNGRLRYADTEALRADSATPAGLGGALREAWARYRTPIAVTEVHNGCTRDEQLRWVAQAWDTAQAVAAEGADIVAVTAWSLLGSHGWDTLLRADGTYESGVYDVAGGTPRETALASLWRALPLDAPRHPVALECGWWERPERLIYADEPLAVRPGPKPRPGRPLLIWGWDGCLVDRVSNACTARGITHVVAGRDLPACSERGDIERLLRTLKPWAVCYVVSDFPTPRTVGGPAHARCDEAHASPLIQACSAIGIPCMGLDAPSRESGLGQASVDVALDHLIDAWPCPHQPIVEQQ
ncbi:dTDP-4-dehydrorhamnose reductase [Sphingomonas sp. MA1305]|uniref:dTDP-4-dehydrorhamnose reductase n=1 Tax=Sphingomonas sp. MA1305 TaxID=2479204 RepID=UPI0018DFDC61|nr:dTDP-4-dehydrorhamnose reductase [Sphingomonas sp. MA1305]MBI0475762.1 dTDP-4-dehydrorhamnose reductase [Sphingomonas sp. MA1305]